MASQMDQSGKDDLKTQFATREGTYRLMTLSEYSRPNRVGYQSNQSNPQVRVSLVTLPATGSMSSHFVQPIHSTTNSSNTSSASTFTGPGSGVGGVVGGGNIGVPGVGMIMSPTLTNSMANGAGHDGGMSVQQQQQQQMHQLSSPTSNTVISHLPGAAGGGAIGGGDRICFNFGKELFVYAYRGCKKLSPDLSKPVDKKLYKGTNPSCHDFNQTVAMTDGAPLLVGFTTGQIQLVQPGKREPGRLFNEERLVDKTKVTCLKWLPRSPNLFLASHASGHLYLYNEELSCTPSAPNYITYKIGDGYAIHTCKSKQPRNPLFRWTFGTTTTGSGTGCINELAFSPCGLMLAIVSQDGFLRVFNYDRMELLGVARSYFGGFLCVCWSPDGKYIVVGGEDDLVTVWSLNERRVVARGQGHRSWVSVVAFDPYTSYAQWDGPDFSDDENPANDGVGTYNRCYTGVNDDGQAQLRDDCGDRYRPPRPMSSSSTIPEKMGTSYRLGSVSQDTQLCLWDITEDILRQSHEIRHRLSSHDPATTVVANGGDTPFVRSTATDAVDSVSVISNRFSANRLSDSCRNSFAETGASAKITSGKNAPAPGKSDKTHEITSTSIKSVTKSNANESTTSSTSGLTAFNTLTQRLTNFSFGGESKKSSADSSHKKTFNFSKSHSSTGNHVNPTSLNATFPSTSSASAPSSAGTVSTSNCFTVNPHHTKDLNHDSSRSSVISKVSPLAAVPTNFSGSIVPSYDPMQLIGTSVCPRFDECPLLEPLVCKKIAHERLTALIFREDCFLTACQDGFIYTWARPGVSSVD